MNKFIILLVLFTANPIAAQQVDHVCKSEPFPLPYTYCVTKTPGSKNPDVLYSLHGGNGNAGQWMTGPRGQEIRKRWAELKIDAPTVIEISYGPFWFISPQALALGSGLLEFTADELMPELESQAGIGPDARRQLIGVSMGGLNSAMLAIFRPAKFTHVVMLSPAIPGVWPKAPTEEFEAYSKRSGLPVEMIKGLSGFFEYITPTRQIWDQNSPLKAGARLLKPGGPKFYISTGTKDTPYNPGAFEFRDMAQAAGMNVVYESIEGGDHGTTNVNAVVDFLKE